MRLHLHWWAAAATVWLNDQVIAEGDLFDRELEWLLPNHESFDLVIELTSPAHDDGAITATWLEISHPALDLPLLAAELATVQVLLPTEAVALAPELTTLLAEWAAARLEEAQFWQRLGESRSRLLPHSPTIKRAQVHLLGNAHIDVAWLWPLAETQDVVQRTFRSVLALKNRFAALTFNQSTMLSYAWVQDYYPDLWPAIQDAVQAGWWEPIGGMWVEADTNLPNGESLIRQIVYGQHWLRQHFGQISRVAWLPDSFGFSWQLPQLLRQGGFEVFVTQKLTWNDTTPFPHRVFWWQGADGSRILTYFCNGIGQGIAPLAIASDLQQIHQETNQPHSLWLYGVGDHGGGPTAAMLERSERLQASPLLPTLRHSTAASFFADLRSTASGLPEDLPIWDDELYLEFHRGTYTSKADQKRQNRTLESQLRQREVCASLDWWHHNTPYPDLKPAWYAVLTNQFHDILPGSAIPAVFADADQLWATAHALCHSPAPTGTQLYVFNSHPWPASQLIELPGQHPHIIETAAQTTLPTQATSQGTLVYAAAISAGHSQTWDLSAADIAEPAPPPPLYASPTCLENTWLRVEFANGMVQQIYDKRTLTNLLSAPITYQFFTDQGQYWDAWNIDPAYAKHSLAGLAIVAVELTEDGPLRASLRVSARFQASSWQITWSLNAYEPIVTVQHHVDWQEEYILAKVAFPLTFSAPHATYEIPLATIQRPTNDPVKWEVPAQRWADLSTEGVGLAVLNDCKYGYDAQAEQLRLTLLRSPTWPDPNSDRGEHHFCYQLLPHQGDWRSATQAATLLNEPLIVRGRDYRYPFTLNAANLAILALKQAEDGQGLILRLAECWGQATTVQFTTTAPVWECNLLEDPEAECIDRTLTFRAYEVKTLRLSL